MLGVPEIQLFHDHLISKPPVHSKAVPWHQDYAFWPVDKPRALSAWLALDDVTEDSGCLEFLPGAHLEGEQPPQDFLGSDKDWGERQTEVRKVPVPAGWVIFHNCLSWQMTAPNQTHQERRAFICITAKRFQINPLPKLQQLDRLFQDELLSRKALRTHAARNVYNSGKLALWQALWTPFKDKLLPNQALRR